VNNLHGINDDFKLAFDPILIRAGVDTLIADIEGSSTNSAKGGGSGSMAHQQL
jgi:hypothetical protein